ncbi:FtsK/SpoIIIE domain-containing protein [Mycolicibacterium fortuitum]|uniref:FtsK/SpoIIIE domain-containing protein n=2 Tax=Mycolicibacterium fortuitum TaxID=1766 RepID=A0AAE4VF06_MYCFO|nr:FtsK/SpoIIIE domain-containing protein [Mycolicibacterium fortuitum]MCV7138378.1 hypothetical protein [Mycolicibacterium fortuitum]MDV7193675.1 FtsK/SpoIIIE domain-containing protein [Mycolicibacterium fortuitum]MDV7207084.1 FtsK/SpoIIIE domain-containing protein [Mycolicibacterium fortuitum]MDV7228595.1 FtsK/SpoIIIE domain-containing protein [Mycolicibacterium fortuitum]MDV7260641.1 FtsK/SpoIIIE domain-containing protein [Mycolicibacterium fortuitum]
MVPNFIQKQAREYMHAHGVRYQQALDAVTAQLDDNNGAAGHSDVAQLLRIPIGVTDYGEYGESFELDLKDEARGGTGPHGLCVGDPGTGKTEFLHTLVVNGCASHSPEDLNWVLAGWHSPQFKRLSDLPHVVSVIANGSDLWGVVVAELDRRLSVLREAEARDIWDYRSMRERNAEMDPLPTLIIVVDDYDILASNDPDLRDAFRRVVRLGRSLGVQCLLAVQPAGLDVNILERLLPSINYILAFRMGAVAARWAGVEHLEARDLRPGSAILRTGTTGKHLQISLTSRMEKATVIEARSQQAAEAVRNALDNRQDVLGWAAEPKAYSPAGLRSSGDGKNLGANVDPSDLRPGDVLEWQGKTMVAVAPGLVADPTEPGVTRTLEDVLMDQKGFEGIFRPTEKDPTSPAHASASAQQQVLEGAQRPDA